MGYLDPPLDWTRPELPQLRDLFVLAYRRRVTAEQLADSAGLLLGTFPEYDNMRTTWTELIKELANQGKLRATIEKAIEDPAVSTYQQRFREMLAAQPVVAAARPAADDAWWKGADRDPYIGREIHLQRLMERRSRLIDIRIAAQVAQAARSVAYLELNFAGQRAFGTGFLIGPDLILTNHHNVFHDQYGDVRAITADFDHEERFAGEPLVLKGKTDAIVKNEAHDWAVVRLERAVDRPPLALGTPWAIAPDDPVIIIQHPVGAFKKFALDTLSIQFVSDDVIQYLADTQDGSSGSPVFNIRMQPIALHHAEVPVEIDVAGQKETTWRNEGIHMSRVMKGLETAGVPFSVNKS
jgi:S1-C subfamily serine protease